MTKKSKITVCSLGVLIILILIVAVVQMNHHTVEKNTVTHSEIPAVKEKKEKPVSEADRKVATTFTNAYVGQDINDDVAKRKATLLSVVTPEVAQTLKVDHYFDEYQRLVDTFKKSHAVSTSSDVSLANRKIDNTEIRTHGDGIRIQVRYELSLPINSVEDTTDEERLIDVKIKDGKITDFHETRINLGQGIDDTNEGDDD